VLFALMHRNTPPPTGAELHPVQPLSPALEPLKEQPMSAEVQP